MKLLFTLTLFFTSIGITFLGAQCEGYFPHGSTDFHANEIRTVINTPGDMFWDLEDGRFQVPYSGPSTPSAIFAAAFWVGGFDDARNLKVAAQQFRSQQGQEYGPGPLTSVGELFTEDCSLWDTIWKVRRYEVIAHIEDFQSDGVVDEIIPAIFGWPGAGNVFFEQVNGFPMPDIPGGYAGFHDENGNGIYEPQRGEYPFITTEYSTQPIPDLLTWHVFNDNRLHQQTHSEPLKFEFQQTCYAYYCSDDTMLNRTLFMDVDVVNRSTSSLDSVYFALWMDPDLGCYTDDFIGSAPDLDAFFVYNEDPVDGTIDSLCDGFVQTYGSHPPVLSAYFLSHPLASFMYYLNPSVGSAPPGMIEPSPGDPLGFYRYMTGHWVDGYPLAVGGTGYDDGPGIIETNYAFFGDPNDPTSWAMTNETLPYGDRRFVASTYLDLIDPNYRKKVSIAVSLHQDRTKDHLENVALMYDQLSEFRDDLAAGEWACSQLSLECPDGCVWPGDINNDGIANHEDLLFLGLAQGQTGTQRNAPLTWAPQPASGWGNDFPSGLNFKYADANGDGSIDVQNDQGIIEIHYGLTHDGYVPDVQCSEGEGLILDGGFEKFNPTLFDTRTFVRLDHEVVPEIYGLAMTVLFDTTFFKSAQFTGGYHPFPDSVSTEITVTGGHSVGAEPLLPGVIEFAITRTDLQNQLLTQSQTLLAFLLQYNRKDLVPGQPDTTYICLANIRAVLADGTELNLGSKRAQYIFLEQPTGVDALEAAQISLFPNPTSGLITIAGNSPFENASYEVYDMTGRIVKGDKLVDGSGSLFLPKGMYTLVIRGTAGPVTRRIVVLQ